MGLLDILDSAPPAHVRFTLIDTTRISVFCTVKWNIYHNANPAASFDTISAGNDFALLLGVNEGSPNLGTDNQGMIEALIYFYGRGSVTSGAHGFDHTNINAQSVDLLGCMVCLGGKAISGRDAEMCCWTENRLMTV